MQDEGLGLMDFFLGFRVHGCSQEARETRVRRGEGDAGAALSKRVTSVCDVCDAGQSLGNISKVTPAVGCKV